MIQATDKAPDKAPATGARSLFEGSYLGDDGRIAPDARLECGICWHVYDPADGDPVWQMPAGTPFAALPDHWRCPNCDAPKHKFMVLDGTRPALAACGEDAAPVRDRLAERTAALAAAYGAADARMRGLPVHNPALGVELIGFRSITLGDGEAGADAGAGDGLFGIVITPWFMNITLIPVDPAGWTDPAPGSAVERVLPSGRYDFVVGELEGVGRVLTCSLFSPMAEFVDATAARIAAQAALEEVMRPNVPTPGTGQAARSPAPAPTLSREVSRRSLFRAAAE
ncbi:MAG: [NiFe]-hydrogenase assembly chaperone HybE [Pseudomonadota bacterium]|jgi:[NiFe] hydrogenase assembly HybE family chaperone